MKRLDLQYENIVIFLFFSSLCFPIINPPLAGKVFYLYGFLPLLSLTYWTHYAKRLTTTAVAALTLLLSFAAIYSALYGIVLFAKMAFYVIGVSYLLLIYQRRGFTLFHYFMAATVAFAAVQYISYVIDPTLGRLLGPQNIYKLLYNSDLRGNANFFPTPFTSHLLYRVSSLSGESGFYAALISVSFILLLADPDIRGRRRRIFIYIYCIGIVLSLSKITLCLPLIGLLVPFRKFMRPITLPFGIVILFLGVSILTTALFSYIPLLKDVGTVVQRLGGYYYFYENGFQASLFGKGDDYSSFLPGYYSLFSPLIVQIVRGYGQIMTGLPLFLAQYGYFALLLLTSILVAFRVSLFKFLVYFLITFSVTPLTSDSFVLLAVFYMFNRRLIG